MRWSLFSFVALAAVLIAEVTALPTPQDGSSGLSLERLAVTKPEAAGKAKAGRVKASNFEKSSKTYGNAAQKGKNRAPKRVLKGESTDHIFEAQTMWHAARRGGHSSTTREPALKAVTNRINDPKNLAFLDHKMNRAKGRAHTAVQSGKTPAKDKNIAESLEQPKATGKAAAADADRISKTNWIKGFYPGKEAPNLAVPYGLSIL